MFLTDEAINNQGEEEYVRVMKNLLRIYKTSGFNMMNLIP
jgi:hypothetical protein